MHNLIWQFNYFFKFELKIVNSTDSLTDEDKRLTAAPAKGGGYQMPSNYDRYSLVYIYNNLLLLGAT